MRFGDWSDWASEAASLDRDALRSRAGVSPALFEATTSAALAGWRNSPSRSALRALRLPSGTAPRSGDPMFRDLLDQTRFLTALREAGVLRPFDVVRLRDAYGDAVEAAPGVPAVTACGDLAERAAKCLYVYEARNRAAAAAGGVRLPRRIWRGIRTDDLVPNHGTAGGQSPERRVRALRRAIDGLLTGGPFALHGEAPVSFTADRRVAAYFADRRGIVIGVDPAETGLVACADVEPRLGGRDPVSGLTEREWIVRLRPSTRLHAADLSVHDCAHLEAIRDPRAVALLDHDDREARYRMDGIAVAARWRWRTQSSGSLVFRIGRGLPATRREVVAAHGFDPLPAEGNLDKVTDFEIWSLPRFGAPAAPRPAVEPEPEVGAPVP